MLYSVEAAEECSYCYYDWQSSTNANARMGDFPAASMGCLAASYLSTGNVQADGQTTCALGRKEGTSRQENCRHRIVMLREAGAER